MKLLFYYQNEETGGASSVPLRKDIEEKYKWDFALIYKDPSQLEEDFNYVRSKLSGYESFKGKILESPSSLFDLMQLDEEIGTKLDRMYLYASMQKDTDLGNSEYSGVYQRVRDLLVQTGTQRSFIKPEILGADDALVRDYIVKKSELKKYSHYFESLFREKEHTLSEKEEELLARTSEFAGTAYETFSIFSNADLDFPSVSDESGSEIKLSHARYYSAIYSKDRGYRERAYKNYYKPFIQYAGTFASLLKGNIKKNSCYASLRKFNSARESALHSNNIPIKVYDNLIETASNNLGPMYRWLEVRKKILATEDYQPFDMYVPLFESSSPKKYSFEEAKDLMLNAFKPLGSEYVESVELVFRNRRIDVFENKGKRSGAYSSGTAYGVEPFILLNWSGLLNDVFTLAHELGHNIHSYYTINTQPYIYADYTIFLAEVASTLNENLLLEFLIRISNSREEKLILLEKYMNDVTATFFRQIMFAEFEKTVYEKSEAGEPLTVDLFKEEFGKAYSKYTGAAMTMPDEEYYTWARIPHFYYNFYVYQYATGFAASEALGDRIKKEGAPAIERYLNFLRSGSSAYSLDILRAAGVDMETEAPVKTVIAKMENTLAEIEKLI